jgi:hypothetical protein
MGLMASPGIAWSNPAGNDLDRGKPCFGVVYGFTLEYWFAKNYGLSTGLEGGFDGCNIRNRDMFARKDTAGNIIKNINERYAFHSLQLPAQLKLKTNQIKNSKFCVWGQAGVNFAFTASARATFSDSIPVANSSDFILIEKENILRSKNEVSRSIKNFRSNFFDIRLFAGAGFEYALDDKASLVAGLTYHNGFINNIFDRDAKKEPNLMRLFSLRLGVLF